MKINHPMIFLVTKQKPKLVNIFIKKKKKKALLSASRFNSWLDKTRRST